MYRKFKLCDGLFLEKKPIIAAELCMILSKCLGADESRDVLPGSREKSYSAQEKLIVDNGNGLLAD